MIQNSDQQLSQEKVTVFDALSCLLPSWINNTDLLEEFEKLDDKSPFACAVVHSFAEFLRLSTELEMWEEDRTSSLMGHVSAHYGWYHILHRLSNPINPGLQVTGSQGQGLSWGYQNKRTEATSGGDFGIAIPISEELCRIAFFQAKNIDSDSSSVSLARTLSGKTNDDRVERNKTANEFAEHLKDVENALAKSFKEGKNKNERVAESLAEMFIFDANNKQVKINDRVIELNHQLQIVKLLILKYISKPVRHNWIHYVIWPTTANKSPRCITLEEAWASYSANFTYHWNDASRRFSNLLIDGFSEIDTPEGWFEVDLTKARSIIGALANLSSSWTIIDKEGGSAGASLVQGLEEDDIHFVALEKLGHIAVLPTIENPPAPTSPTISRKIGHS